MTARGNTARPAARTPEQERDHRARVAALCVVAEGALTAVADAGAETCDTARVLLGAVARWADDRRADGDEYGSAWYAAWSAYTRPGAGGDVPPAEHPALTAVRLAALWAGNMAGARPVYDAACEDSALQCVAEVYMACTRGEPAAAATSAAREHYRGALRGLPTARELGATTVTGVLVDAEGPWDSATVMGARGAYAGAAGEEKP